MDWHLNEGSSYFYRLLQVGTDYTTPAVETYTSLAAPTQLTAVAVSPTEVDLTWDDNSAHEEGYEIEWGIVGGNWNGTAFVGADVTQFAVKTDDLGHPLKPGTVYQFRVGAIATDIPRSSTVVTQATTPVA